MIDEVLKLLQINSRLEFLSSVMTEKFEIYSESDKDEGQANKCQKSR
jgi:hypothetical protein